MSSRLTIQTIKELTSWLIENQIPIHKWGIGHSKTIAHLFQEINKGECQLRNDPPTRILPVVQVIIRLDELVLVELKQELNDLRIRNRCIPPSEKMKPNESWHSATIRCLNEELSLKESQFEILSKTCEPIILERMSESYPDLPSQYHIYKVNVNTNHLPSTEFWTDEKAERGQKQAIRRHLWGWIAYNKIHPL